MRPDPSSFRAFARRPGGFSLIELLVAIALIAIIMGIAVPSFRAYMVNSQLSNAGNEFVMGTMYARAEAISKNRCVTMCMSTNSQADSPVCATSGADWNVGWIIFANQKCDSNPSDTTAELLKVYIGKPDGATMESSPVTRSVRFDSRGMTTVSGSGQIRLAPPGESYTKVICIASTGRARIADALSGCSNSL